jgi:hypothetical protein
MYSLLHWHAQHMQNVLRGIRLLQLLRDMLRWALNCCMRRVRLQQPLLNPGQAEHGDSSGTSLHK